MNSAIKVENSKEPKLEISSQGLKSSMVNFSSVALGVFNNLFVYPKFLAIYGFVQAIINLVKLIYPFSLWGLNAVMNRYHTDYRTSNYKGFIFDSLRWAVLIFIPFSLLYFLILPATDERLSQIFPYFSNVEDNLIGLFFLVIVTAAISIFRAVVFINKKATVPTLITRIVETKILLPVLIVLAGMYVLSKGFILLGMIVIGLISLALYMIYLHRKGWLDFSKSEINRINVKNRDVFSFGSFGIFNEIGSFLAFSVDIILVNLLLGDKSAGIYAIFLFLANVIKIPMDSLSGIMLPIVSTLWRENDLKKLKAYYKRTSLGLFVIAAAIFMLIFSSINDILRIIKREELIVAKYIFLFVAAGILVNVLTFLNGYIIIQSKKYKWNLAFTLILGVTNLFLTYYFIVYLFEDPFKAAGAACSTAVALIIFNLLKTLYVYVRFKMHPISWQLGIVFILAGINLVILTYISTNLGPWLNMTINAFIILCAFLIPIYGMSLSKDINNVVNKFLINPVLRKINQQ